MALKGTAYDACPYCLTEIVVEQKETAKIETAPEQVMHETKRDKSATSIEPAPAQLAKKQGCAHHFGYLSQRSTKEKIPEECMMCENIVQCMLKNVTS